MKKGRWVRLSGEDWKQDLGRIGFVQGREVFLCERKWEFWNSTGFGFWAHVLLPNLPAGHPSCAHDGPIHGWECFRSMVGDLVKGLEFSLNPKSKSVKDLEGFNRMVYSVNG